MGMSSYSPKRNLKSNRFSALSTPPHAPHPSLTPSSGSSPSGGGWFRDSSGRLSKSLSQTPWSPGMGMMESNATTPLRSRRSVPQPFPSMGNEVPPASGGWEDGRRVVASSPLSRQRPMDSHHSYSASPSSNDRFMSASLSHRSVTLSPNRLRRWDEGETLMMQIPSHAFTLT